MLSRSLAPEDVAGEAFFSGCLAAIDLDRAALETRLPQGMSLSSDSAHEHRCLIAFGEQSEGATFFGGVALPWNVRYHEAMVGVPCVLRQASTEPHLFVRGMPCDFLPAVWNGNVYYGFMKQFSRIAWNGAEFIAHSDAEQPDFHVQVAGTPTTPVHDGNWQWICDAAALPVLGRRDDGTLVTSRFDWDFSDAVIEPITVHVQPSRRFPELTLGGAASRPDHSYRVGHMRWRLSWPRSGVPGVV